MGREEGVGELVETFDMEYIEDNLKIRVITIWERNGEPKQTDRQTK